MTKALSVTGADANGASPKQRPPPTYQVVVVVEKTSDRGRCQEGEEEAGGWNDAWRTTMEKRGSPSRGGGGRRGVGRYAAHENGKEQGTSVNLRRH